MYLLQTEEIVRPEKSRSWRFQGKANNISNLSHICGNLAIRQVYEVKLVISPQVTRDYCHFQSHGIVVTPH